MTDSLPTIDSLLTDLDLLMSEDPLNLSLDSATPGGRKLDAIIAYNRNLRAMREAGKGKAAQAKARSTGAKLDIASLMKSVVVGTPKGGNVIKRRV